MERKLKRRVKTEKRWRICLKAFFIQSSFVQYSTMLKKVKFGQSMKQCLTQAKASFSLFLVTEKGPRWNIYFLAWLITFTVELSLFIAQLLMSIQRFYISCMCGFSVFVQIVVKLCVSEMLTGSRIHSSAEIFYIVTILHPYFKATGNWGETHQGMSQI